MTAPDTTSTGETKTDADGTTDAKTTDSTTSTTTEGAATATSSDADAAGATEDKLGDAGQKALAEERKNRKAAEKAARELKARLDELESANLTAAQKVERERDELKTKYEQLSGELSAARAEKAITKAIKAAKVSEENAALIAELVKTSEYDDEAENAAELVAEVKRRHPHLFKAAAPGPVDTGSGKGSTPTNGRAQMGAFLAGRGS